MTVHDIILKYLNDNGYDGLTDCDDCACKKDDLAPCNDIESMLNCNSGYLIKCKGCSDYGYCLSTEKTNICPQGNK